MSEFVVSIAMDDYIIQLQKLSPMGLMPDTRVVHALGMPGTILPPPTSNETAS